MGTVNGCTLRALLEHLARERHRLDVPCAVYIAIECCKSLAAIDRAVPVGLRVDISPETIVVSSHGVVSLDRPALTALSDPSDYVPVGGFGYLSPEVASGLDHDRRSHVFTLGVVLWELLTGDRLFVGATDYQTIERVREAHVPALASTDPEIDATLEAIVRGALAKDPALRPPSAGELGESLVRYLASRAIRVSADDLAAFVRGAAK